MKNNIWDFNALYTVHIAAMLFLSWNFYSIHICIFDSQYTGNFILKILFLFSNLK